MTSARDAQRALLDALLGEERDKPPEEQTGPVHFSHPSIDKHLLIGCSPRELLKGTRFAPAAPSQPLVPPNETQIREWNSLSREQKNDYGYELELLQVLRRLVRDCDQRISTLQARMQREEAERTSESLSRDAQTILATEEAYQVLVAKVKAQGVAGNMAEALRIAHDLKSLDDRRESSIAQSVTPSKNVVCPVSGNVMALIDTDERILAHYEGRAYSGWGIIRKKLAELESIDLLTRSRRSSSNNRDSSWEGRRGSRERRRSHSSDRRSRSRNRRR